MQSSIFSRANEVKTVYTCFCTDVIHEGHLNIINEAKKSAELLSDVFPMKRLFRYNKFPTISQEERVKLYRSIRRVDEVVIQDDMLYDDVITLDSAGLRTSWRQLEGRSGKGNPRPCRRTSGKAYGGELVDIPYTYNEKVKKDRPSAYVRSSRCRSTEERD